MYPSTSSGDGGLKASTILSLVVLEDVEISMCATLRSARGTNE